MKKLTPEAYEADEPIVNLGPSDLKFLTDNVRKNERKRIRLCAHKGGENLLHEMFVAYVRETYVRPNKHFGKDESLHVIEGSADFIFLDDEGNVTDVIPLGDYDSGRQFYCRIPATIYHTFIIHSDTIVLHETANGPFRREDTLFAPWAPADTDAEAGKAYLEKLAGQTAALRNA